MKQKIMALFLWATGFALQAQDLKTKIEEVTVFQNGAQVKRSGSLTLQAGQHQVKIKDISPMLRKESIQVKGEGDFTILAVNYQTTNTPQKVNTAAIKELDAREKDLNMKVEDLTAQMQVMQQEENMINSLAGISQQQYNAIVEMVVKAKQVMQVQLSELKTRQLKASRQLQDYREQLRLTQQELTSLRTPKSIFGNEVVISVNAKKEVKADFTLSYIVTNARWYPTYDLRVKNISEPLAIEYKANISQQTGEDWNGVKLRLSTTDPSLSGQRPKLQKWTLNLNQGYQQPQQAQSNYQKYTGTGFTKLSGTVTDEYGEALPFANIMAVNSTVGTATDVDGHFSMTIPAGVTQISVTYIGYNKITTNITGENMTLVMSENATELETVEIVSYKDEMVRSSSQNIVRSEVRRVPGVAGDIRGGRAKKHNATSSVPVQVTPVENIVSTEFVIDERYDIVSDTKFYTVNIQTITAPAMYQYYCAPKLDKDVFLTAQLTQWETYNLLEGQANVFFEGTYVGTSLMDVRYITDTLNISLGRDKSIQVERKKSKELSRRQFLGSDMLTYRDWDITVQNSKQQPVNLIVEDQFPVSADSRIEVKQEEKSGGKVNENTGIVTWMLQMDKQARKDLKLKYAVKYPKNTFVGLD